MKITLMFSFLFLTFMINAQQSPIGIWNTGKDNTKVEILDDDKSKVGTIISSDNVKANIGKRLIKDIQLVDGKWQGKLFADKKGKWMDAVFKIKDNSLHITVKKGLMSKTIKWSKD